MRSFLGIIILILLLVLAPVSSVVASGFENQELVTPSSAETSNTSSLNSGDLFMEPPMEMQNAIKEISKTISTKNLKFYLNTLVGFGSRLYRAPGMANASIWLHDVLKGNGRLEVEYHNFTVIRPTWGMFVLSNVILTLPGLNKTSDRIYYMYAHSDAVQMTDSTQWLTNTPGADDDGSGCVAVLEAARVLSRYDFQDTIKFAFFQAEEIGLVGSRHYAENVTAWNENVVGGIDYDMIGYSSGTQPYDLKLMYNAASSEQGLYMVDVNDRYDIGLSLNYYQVSSSIPSDVQSFYNQGFPTVFGIEYEFSPYYHSTSDLVKYINFTLISKCTHLAVASLAEMARLMYTDLSVIDENITVSNSQPVEGENVTINVNITNTGNLDADDLEVIFNCDGEQFASKRLSVPAYGMNTTTVYWNASFGTHNITVTLDPNNEIEESDETNNTGSVKIWVNDYPKAVLSATPMEIYTDDSVFFNGSLSFDFVGGISKFNFSFGDGNYSGWMNLSAITHAYEENGWYTASLAVRDMFGMESPLVNQTIQVKNRPPLADPYSNLTQAMSLTLIQFFANATDPDGQVTTSWTFGDGGSSSHSNPVHQYSRSGIYNVELKIEDDDGASVAYKLIVIIRNREPTCSIEIDKLTGNVTTKLDFLATANDLDGLITKYEWDFGDNTNRDISNPSHIYSKPGIYNVQLKVWDDEGAMAAAQVSITITDLPPVAIADVSANLVYAGDEVYFNGVTSYDLEGPINFQWDFGDGNSSMESTPTHSYSKAGIYLPTLLVMDAAGQVSKLNLSQITVENQKPNAKFRIFGNFSEKGTLFFDGTESFDVDGKIDYQWLFGDGKEASGMIVSHVFPGPGSYNVTLTVTDDLYVSDSLVKIAIVTASGYKPDDPSEPVNKTGDTNETSDPNNESKDPKNGGNAKEKEDTGLESLLMSLNVFWLLILIILIIYTFFYRKKSESKLEPTKLIENKPQLQYQNSPEPEGTPEQSIQEPVSETTYEHYQSPILPSQNQQLPQQRALDNSARTGEYLDSSSIAQPVPTQEPSLNMQLMETPVVNENIISTPQLAATTVNTSTKIHPNVSAQQAQPVQEQNQTPRATGTETQ